MAKTYNNLLPKIYDYENLEKAYKLARAGKRHREEVMRFHYNYESNLINIQNHLINGTWKTGRYRPFILTEPVYRVGAALPFEDRVLHHAIMNIINPIFERSFIADTYACIAGRGTHAGADRAQYMMRKVKRSHGVVYVFKADISGYFYNINHAILKRLIRRRIACKATLRVIDEIIDSTATGNNPKGIPLGNLTSQLFANIYLGALDDYIKHTLRIKNYVRYMDDFVVIHHDKKYLHEIRRDIERFLLDELALTTNRKTQVFKIDKHRGLDFLGYRTWTTHRKLRKCSVKRVRKRLRKMQIAYAQGDIGMKEVLQSVNSWLAHASHADTHTLVNRVLNSTTFTRGVWHECRAGNDTRRAAKAKSETMGDRQAKTGHEDWN